MNSLPADHDCPRRVATLRTAAATAPSFIGKRGRLAFRWQTG